jgi:hypothetical protein
MVAAVVLVCAVAMQAPVLLDRTLAIVGGRTITLSDARTAAALGLIRSDGTPAPASPDTGGDGRSVTAAMVDRLVERELMLREAERYAPEEPAAAAVTEQLMAAERRVGGAEPLAAVLRAGGFTEARLRAWVRDDLRIASYLGQRFAADDRRADLIADWISDLRRRSTVVTFAP